MNDVRAVCAELERKGVRILKRPADYWVCRAMEITDPDGNTVILHQRAGGTVGQDSRRA